MNAYNTSEKRKRKKSQKTVIFREKALTNTLYNSYNSRVWSTQ